MMPDELDILAAPDAIQDQKEDEDTGPKSMTNNHPFSSEVDNDDSEENNDSRKPLPESDDCTENDNGMNPVNDNGGADIYEDNDEVSIGRKLSKSETVWLDNKNILRADDFPSIYVRKVLENECATSRQPTKKKERRRTYNKRYPCPYCDSLVSDIGDHLKSKHKIEGNIEAERIRGTHIHNEKVIKNKSGELILARRIKRSFKAHDFRPCPSCLKWMVRSNILYHKCKPIIHS